MSGRTRKKQKEREIQDRMSKKNSPAAGESKKEWTCTKSGGEKTGSITRKARKQQGGSFSNERNTKCFSIKGMGGSVLGIDRR